MKKVNFLNQKINEIVKEKKRSNRRIQCIEGTKITPQIEEIYLMICDQRSELEEKMIKKKDRQINK